MGAALAGLLVLGVLFSGALILFRIDLLGNRLVTDAVRDASEVAGEQVRTQISLTGDQVTNAGGSCELTATADNTGATSIATFDEMDLIIQFTTGDNLPQLLTFVTGDTPSTGEWAKRSIAGPFEPGIWNPDELMVLKARLSQLTGTGTTAIALTLGAPNGVTDLTTTDAFALPCPAT